MALKGIICAACDRPAWKRAGGVNRAKRIGANLYCGKECAATARQSGKSVAQRKAEKAVYDADYREKNFARLKVQKAANFKRTYDPIKNKERVKLRMPQHVEYCRRPEYRAYKRTYDQEYRARKFFGEWWQVAILLVDLQSEVLSRATRYDLDLTNGRLNKSTNRRRDYDRTHSNRS